MQDVQTWLESGMTGADEEAQEAYRYFMGTDPHQREFLGPIQHGKDALTGKEMRWREGKIGMVRNSPEENMKSTKIFLDPIPHVRIEKAKPLQGWYSAKMVEGANPRERPRPCFTDAVLTEPYGGACAVNCKFCYINSGFRGYRGSGLATVPIDYGEQVKKMLASMRTSAAGYYSSFIDPFLPLEDYYHNTQAGALAFVEAGLPIFFLSRLRYPNWAVELLQCNKYSYAQKSINTSDPKLWAKLSPGALPLNEHFKDLKRLHKKGMYISIQCNPIVPGVVTHEDIERLFEKLADSGVNHVIVKFVEAGYSWAPTMVERMIRTFGERGKVFGSLFTQNIGGQRTIAEEYRLAAHERYLKKATQVGMTFSLCYEYKYARDEKGEIINKVGISIGKDFITSEQCHGKRVPMWTREKLTDPFREVTECPPQGCLTCGDNQPEGIGACGSKLYSAAKNLTLADFRKSVYDTTVEPYTKEKLVQIKL